MSFFGEIWQIINESDVELKFSNFAKFYENFKRGDERNFTRLSPAQNLTEPCYAKFCKVFSMKELNKKTKQKDKNLAFIHSVAHIEFSAVDIALDACYRFDGLPREYYADWLEVAEDEIRHFKMIEHLLIKQGGKYGDLPVHDGLFVALQKTQNSLISRMALLPRYMEANGLDANAHIIEKLSANGADGELISALLVILDEEISHVAKGDRWFKFACEQGGISCDEYVKIICNLYPNAFKSARELNETARLKAGFSANELEIIKNYQKGSANE